MSDPFPYPRAAPRALVYIEIPKTKIVLSEFQLRVVSAFGRAVVINRYHNESFMQISTASDTNKQAEPLHSLGYQLMVGGIVKGMM